MIATALKKFDCQLTFTLINRETDLLNQRGSESALWD
jgi:hypothetical protein